MKNHDEIIKLLNLDKKERKTPPLEKAQIPKWPIVAAFIVLILITLALIYNNHALEKREDQRAIEKKQQQLAAEEERKNQIQYAKIQFLDSFPPACKILQDNKTLFAQTPEGYWTFFTAKKDALIQNIPIKQDTIVTFSFQSEAFKPLERKIAYYDWFPTNDEKIQLQKTFRKITLEPIQTPLIPNCTELAKLHPAYENACQMTTFLELMTRQQYQTKAEQAQNIDPNETKTSPIQPSSKQPSPTSQPNDFSPTLPPTSLLTGAITISTDIPDTKLFFLGEPLVIFNENNTITQVRLQPDKPYTFSNYGNNKPIPLTQKLSLRLEAPNFQPFVFEILPHHWHCTPKNDEEIKQIIPPTFLTPAEPQPLLQHLCNYTINFDIKFKELPTNNAN